MYTVFFDKNLFLAPSEGMPLSPANSFSFLRVLVIFTKNSKGIGNFIHVLVNYTNPYFRAFAATVLCEMPSCFAAALNVPHCFRAFAMICFS